MTQIHAAVKGNICVKCGLCCDGSMFRQVRVDQADDLSFLKQMGVECFKVGDKLLFRLPCRGQAGKRCRLYHDARRCKVCKEFKCKLLKQYLSGEISYASALGVIREILLRRKSIKEFSELLQADHNSGAACRGNLRRQGPGGPAPQDFLAEAGEQALFSFIRELELSGKMDDLSFRRTYSKKILDCFAFKELLKRRFYKKNSKASVLSVRRGH